MQSDETAEQRGVRSHLGKILVDFVHVGGERLALGAANLDAVQPAELQDGLHEV